MYYAIVAFVCLVTAFTAGVLLSKRVFYDVAAMRHGTQAAFNAVSTDMRGIDDRVKKIEAAIGHEAERTLQLIQ